MVFRTFTHALESTLPPMREWDSDVVLMPQGEYNASVWPVPKEPTPKRARSPGGALPLSPQKKKMKKKGIQGAAVVDRDVELDVTGASFWKEIAEGNAEAMAVAEVGLTLSPG